jgi:hypothetical protein
VPVSVAGDEIAVAGLALVVSRLEAASGALEALDGDHPLRPYLNEIGDRLRADTARWLRLLLTYAEALSLTPASRARLGIDVAVARRAQMESLDLSRLTDSEVETLREIVAKAESGP